MSLKYGKAEVSAIAAVLDQDYASADEAAAACLVAMEEVFAKRAKFAVVAQLAGTKERSSIPASDPEAIKLCLGWYATEGDARKAEESLRVVTATGDSFRTWSLPMLHQSPTELTAARKAVYATAEEKAREAATERLRKQIADIDAAAQERARGGRGSCDNCSHIAGEHGYDGSSRGACKLPECKGKCEKFTERRAA